MATNQDKTALINAREWFHSIEIEKGLVTPGRVPHWYLLDMLKSLGFPESLEGLSVLDIGAWDGFFSFEAERRGAKRVVAYDLHPPNHYGFVVAKELLRARSNTYKGVFTIYLRHCVVHLMWYCSLVSFIISDIHY